MKRPKTVKTNPIHIAGLWTSIFISPNKWYSIKNSATPNEKAKTKGIVISVDPEFVVSGWYMPLITYSRRWKIKSEKNRKESSIKAEIIEF